MSRTHDILPAEPGAVTDDQLFDLAFGLVLADQGYTSDQCSAMIRRIQAARAEVEARYPLADPDLPLPEQITADEKTLRAALRERSAGQYAQALVSHE